MAKKKSIDKPIAQPPQIDRLYAVQLVLICLAIFLAPLIAGKLLPVPAFIIQLMVFLAGGIWLYRSRTASQTNIPMKHVLYSLAILILLVTVSVFGSINKGLSLRELLNIASYLLLFLLVISYGKNKAAITSILASLCLSALVVDVIGLREYILTASAGWRTFSTFFNPDFLAGFTAMMLPVVLAWYLSGNSIKVSVITGITAVLTFANLLLTGSRLGFIAAAGGMILFAVLSIIMGSIKKPQLIKLVVITVPILLVMFLLSTPLVARMGSVAAVKAESHSGSFRLLTWKGTAKMAISNPIIGTGIGTFEEGYPRYAIVGFTKLAHNSYIQLAGEAGIPAMLALITFLGTAILPAMWKIIRRRLFDLVTDQTMTGEMWMPDPKLILCGIVVGAVVSIARNAVDSDWYITSIGISFWVLAGMTVSLSGGSRSINLKSAYRNGLLIITTIFLVYGFMLLIGELWNQSARSQVLAGNPESAVTYYKNAQRYEPLNADYHRRLGNLFSMMNQGVDNNVIDSSINEYKIAIRLAPSSAKGYYQLAKVYEKAGQTSEAVEMYKKSLEYDPQSPQTLLMLARQYQLMRKTTDALDVYRQMVAVENSPYETVRAVPEIVEPSYIFAHKILGDDYAARNEPSKASDEYRHALDRINAYQASMKGLGEILEVSGSRNTEIESQVEIVKSEVIQKIDQLKKNKVEELWHKIGK